MTIGSVSAASSSSIRPARSGEHFAKLKKTFDELGAALQSGNVADAKTALAQLEQNGPPQGQQGNNPIAEKLAALGKALDSGDVSGAQQDFAEIKTALAQHRQGGGAPGAGGPPGGSPPGGPPPGGKPDGDRQGSGASNSSSASQTFDPKDTNQDGKVSLQELLAFVLKSSGGNSQAASAVTSAVASSSIDTFA